MNSKETNKPKIVSNLFLIGLIIMLVVGVVIGYGIWGKKEKTPNAQRLLSQVADHIESLEDKNSTLKDQIKKMNDAVERGKKAVQSREAMKQDLVKLRDENKTLTRKMENYNQLQMQAKELNALRAENRKVKKALEKKAALTERVTLLEKENEELKVMVEKVKDVVKKPVTPPLQVAHPSS
jgi:phage shock protein A